MRSAIVAWLICLLCQTALVPSVQAHAELQETIPQNGDVLSDWPAQLSLRFNEPVSVIRLQLLDGNGQPIELGDVTNADHILSFGPLVQPGHGQYLLSFWVLSMDSHPIAGSVGFAVGALPPPAISEVADVDAGALWLFRFVRAVMLVSLLAVTGMVLYLRVFNLADSVMAWRRRILVGGSLLALTAALGGLGLTGVLLTGSAMGGIFTGDTWEVAASSSYFISTGFMVLGLAIIMNAAILDIDRPPGNYLAIAGALLAVTGFGASGHAAVAGWLLRPLFVIHVLMAALWFAGVWLLYRLSKKENAGPMADILNHFSRYAVPLVAVLLVCAAALVWHQLGHINSLFNSGYGTWLLLKTALVILVLSLAAMNRWRHTPALVETGEAALPACRRSLRLEFLLMIAVLAVTAVLASTSPPARRVEESGTTQTMTLSATGGLELTLTASPLRAGMNNLILTFSQNQQPLQPQEVTVFWSSETAGIEPVRQVVLPGEDGVYRVEQAGLIIPGVWQLRVDALIDDFTLRRFTTELVVQ